MEATSPTGSTPSSKKEGGQVEGEVGGHPPPSLPTLKEDAAPSASSSTSSTPSDSSASSSSSTEERLKLKPKPEPSAVLNAQLIAAARAHSNKTFARQKDVQEILGADALPDRSTVYFKGCVNCSYIVDSPSVKVLIEGCKDCLIIVRKNVRTEIIEIWRCENTTLVIDTSVKTLQADLCKKLEIRYAEKKFLGSIIWAGIYDFNITFLDEPSINLKTGYVEMKVKYPKLNDTTDQFIIRFLEGKLTSEAVIRLSNGYPTTQREAIAFEEEQERNKKLAEEYMRKLIAITAPSLGPSDEGPKNVH